MNRLVVIRIKENPGTFSLSTDMQKIKSMRLVYFKLGIVDPNKIPQLLFFNIEGFSAFEQAQSIVSGIPGMTTNSAPIYFKVDFGLGGSYHVIHGKQESLSWKIMNKHSANLLTGQINLYDQDGNLYDLSPLSSEVYFVFEAEFEAPNYLEPTWRNNRLIQNNLDG